MGEWERGLEAAHAGGLIDQELKARLVGLQFERTPPRDGFPIRLALFVIGALLLAVAAFAAVVRLLGDDPSETMISLVFFVLSCLVEVVARLIRRAKGLQLLSGIVGGAAGASLGVALAVIWPGEPNAGHGALAALFAAAWSISWFLRTRAGVVAAAALVECAVAVLFFGEWVGINDETIGAVLCALGFAAALSSILGKIRPSLPPLVAALLVVGIGCISQGEYGGVAVAGIGSAISAALFLLAYRRGEVLMTAATAISMGVWAVVLAIALTSGALAPLIVAAVVGVSLIVWGSRLARR